MTPFPLGSITLTRSAGTPVVRATRSRNSDAVDIAETSRGSEAPECCRVIGIVINGFRDESKREGAETRILALTRHK